MRPFESYGVLGPDDPKPEIETGEIEFTLTGINETLMKHA
jgi:hypothetical protein